MDASGAILLPHLHPSRQPHLFKLQREPTYAVTGIETLGIHHKFTTMSKSFRWKYLVGYMELLHKPSPDLLFDKDTLCMWLTCPCTKKGIFVKYLKYTNAVFFFSPSIFIGNHSGVVLSINSREMHSYLVSWYLQLNAKTERLFSVSFYFSLVMSQNCKHGCKLLVERRFPNSPVEKNVHRLLLVEKDAHLVFTNGLRICYSNSNYSSKCVALGTFNATFFLSSISSSSLCLFLGELTVTF